MKQEKIPFLAFLHKGSGIRAFMLFFYSIGLSLSLSSISVAATFICKNEKSVRTLRTDKAPEGCKAVYTKGGVDQVVGSSMRENGCETITDGIRKTLEDNSWKCREVKEAVVSDLSQ